MNQVEEVVFTLPWGKLAGKVWTGREGPKVLCIHGMFSNASCYDNLIPLMLKSVGGTWCSLDLPGSGRSDKHPDGMLVEMLQFTHDLQRVVEELGWGEVHVIAHSASTPIAFYLAAVIPETVRSVVSIDAVVYNLLLDTSFWSERVQVLLEKSLHVYRPKYLTRDRALEKLRYSRVSEIKDESLETLFSRSAVSGPEGYILKNDPRFYIAFLYPTMTERMHQELLKEIRCSTLLIFHGSQPHIMETPMCKATVETLKNHLGSGFEMLTIQGSHDMIMDEPGPVAAALHRHFTRLNSKL